PPRIASGSGTNKAFPPEPEIAAVVERAVLTEKAPESPSLREAESPSRIVLCNAAWRMRASFCAAVSFFLDFLRGFAATGIAKLITKRATHRIPIFSLTRLTLPNIKVYSSIKSARKLGHRHLFVREWLGRNTT